MVSDICLRSVFFCRSGREVPTISIADKSTAHRGLCDNFVSMPLLYTYLLQGAICHQLLNTDFVYKHRPIHCFLQVEAMPGSGVNGVKGNQI